MRNILVVGAGISGATVAERLSGDRDNNITIIDRRDTIAGNCYDDRDENGIMVHRYGSHIFHTDLEDVWHYLNTFSEFNSYEHKVVAVIKGKEIPLPFNLNSIRMSFPEDQSSRLITKLKERFTEGTKIPIREFMEQDDEDLRNLAEYIYEYVFLHYTEKQWGLKPDQIDGAVTARVPVSVSEDNRYFTNRYQGIPVRGYTAMISRMLDRDNVELRLNTDFKDVDISEFDEIFYTGAVDELMDYCLGPLPYRSVYFETEVHDVEHYQSGAAVNYPNDYGFTRIHEYKYYLDDRSDKTTIAKEYSEDFVPGRNERYYPIPSDSNTGLYNRYLALAKERYPNMRFLGRLGDYRYYDMDKAVKRALDVCDEFMEE